MATPPVAEVKVDVNPEPSDWRQAFEELVKVTPDHKVWVHADYSLEAYVPTLGSSVSRYLYSQSRHVTVNAIESAVAAWAASVTEDPSVMDEGAVQAVIDSLGVLRDGIYAGDDDVKVRLTAVMGLLASTMAGNGEAAKAEEVAPAPPAHRLALTGARKKKEAGVVSPNSQSPRRRRPRPHSPPRLLLPSAKPALTQSPLHAASSFLAPEPAVPPYLAAVRRRASRATSPKVALTRGGPAGRGTSTWNEAFSDSQSDGTPPPAKEGMSTPELRGMEAVLATLDAPGAWAMFGDKAVDVLL